MITCDCSVAIVVPIRLGFNLTVEPGWTFQYFFELVVDLSFVADIVLNFCTGYHARTPTSTTGRDQTASTILISDQKLMNRRCKCTSNDCSKQNGSRRLHLCDSVAAQATGLQMFSPNLPLRVICGLVSDRLLVITDLTGWFTADVLACMPVSLLSLLSSSSSINGFRPVKAVRLFRLAKILRLHRLKRYLDQSSDDLTQYNIIGAATKALVLVYLTCHILCGESTNGLPSTAVPDCVSDRPFVLTFDSVVGWRLESLPARRPRRG